MSKHTFPRVKLYLKRGTMKVFPWDADKPQTKSCIDWLTDYNGYQLEKIIEVDNHFTELRVVSYTTRKDNTVFKAYLRIPDGSEVIVDFRMEEMMKAILIGVVDKGYIKGNFEFTQGGSQVRLSVL